MLSAGASRFCNALIRARAVLEAPLTPGENPKDICSGTRAKSDGMTGRTTATPVRTAETKMRTR